MFRKMIPSILETFAEQIVNKNSYIKETEEVEKVPMSS